MSADAVVLTETHERVAVVTINRPDRMNALNMAVREAIVDLLARWAEDPAVQVVILTGAGQKSFVAGADISEFAQRTPLEQIAVGQRLPVFEAAAEFPKPTIAAINGYCLGGGCELALACDIRVAADTARFGQPEVNLGILPGGGGTQRLTRLVGLGAAYKMLYTGEMITAAEALRIGLVEEVVPSEGLLERARALATTIARKSPVALRLIKQAVRASGRMTLDDGLRYETALLGIAFSSADKEEGVRAFLDKREAQFTGR
jgi:enoyl-CoA hydratase